jgi:Raf kinase inhibitor-like YbhB/YbcL family protein
MTVWQYLHAIHYAKKQIKIEQSTKKEVCMPKIFIYSLEIFVAVSIWLAPVMAADITLTSPQLKDGATMDEEQVFNGMSCHGKNISPALNWKNAPAGVKSYAVTVYDPDAPTGSGWWHWVIFNIPAAVNGLAENAGNLSAGVAPKGSVQSRTDFGSPGYGGACPPSGDSPHRYQFTIYALDLQKIELNEDAGAAMVGFYLNQHLLAKDTITVRYGR